jgi:hypothetical protein
VLLRDAALHSELTGVRRCIHHGRAPIPRHVLIEDDVAGHVHALRHRVINPISLGIGLVADEDHGSTTVVELLLVRSHHLDMGHTPKGAQVMYGQLPAMVCLEWSLPG